ncbi:hypothetical protein KAS50_01800, partial [bacterium]|nr:hypothetical protein [bacterium]
MNCFKIFKKMCVFLFIGGMLFFFGYESAYSQMTREIQGNMLLKGSTSKKWYSGTSLFSDPDFIREAEQNTKRLYPELRKDMEVFRKSAGVKRTFSIGDSTRFYAFNLPERTFYTISAELRRQGANVNVWVEKKEIENQHITEDVIQDIINTLEESTPGSRDSTKGIIELENEYFGDLPNKDGDNRLDILILDIQDGWGGSGAYMAGYFSPIDQILESEYSNKRDMLYIDSYPAIYGTSGKRDSRFASETVSHELQHLIHYNYDQDEESWINEGLSVYAQYLCGFGVQKVSDYLADTNRDLTDIVADLDGLINDEVIKDYHKMGLF